jgi:DinB superfamily
MTPDHEQLIARLKSSTAALSAAVQQVPRRRESEPPGPGEWSVQETLVHVRNVAVLVLGLRIRRLLYERDPIFADYDDGPVRQHNLQQPEPLGEVLDMVTDEHEQIARLLKTLPDSEWQQAGRHPERGPMSVEFLTRWAVEHAEEHADQIVKTARLLRGRHGC